MNYFYKKTPLFIKEFVNCLYTTGTRKTKISFSNKFTCLFSAHDIIRFTSWTSMLNEATFWEILLPLLVSFFHPCEQLRRMSTVPWTDTNIPEKCIFFFSHQKFHFFLYFHTKKPFLVGQLQLVSLVSKKYFFSFLKK